MLRNGIMKILLVAVILSTAGATIASAGTYNHEAAKNYALKYAENPNWLWYRTYDQDCTNFVSQSLYAGGWSMIRYVSAPEDAWFYKNGYNAGVGYSYSWTVANDLFVFMSRHSGRAEFVGFSTQKPPYSSKLKVGDIIQIDFERDGRIDHSLIITGYGSNGNLLVSGHSVTLKDESLEAVINRNSGARFIGWHIKDSY